MYGVVYFVEGYAGERGTIHRALLDSFGREEVCVNEVHTTAEANIAFAEEGAVREVVEGTELWVFPKFMEHSTTHNFVEVVSDICADGNMVFIRGEGAM